MTKVEDEVADRPLRVVALAGGVGGAKLAHGLQLAMGDDGELTVVVNTADDFRLYGLHISPDLDTVLYTLAGIANPETGWGIRDDTFHALDMIGRYGEDPWFRLGDRDFATHVLRTHRLEAGRSLTEIMDELGAALGVRTSIVPMTDEPVATLVDTPAGRLDFQQYFVARRHADQVLGVVFDGIEHATVSSVARNRIAIADVIVFCPSNPIVSIGPILAVPGMRDAIAAASGHRVCVSPIVGGQALKGPAADMLRSLGHEVSSLGVARLYEGLIDTIVVDRADTSLVPAIEALGIDVLVTETVMRSESDRRELATRVLRLAMERQPIEQVT